MVTAQPDPRRRVTRFTDSDGRLELDALPRGDAPLTVRYPGMVSQTLATEQRAVTLSPDSDFLRTLPSSRWLDLLPEGDRKREFTVNCGTCHEISHDRVMLDGRPRSEAEWRAAIAMMRAMDAYEVIPPDFDDDAYAAWLAENLSAERIQTLAPAPPGNAAALAAVEITEYDLPRDNALPHDLVIGPDRRIWITAFFYDELWALDPENGEIETYSVDHRPDINAQPRALEFDADGALWVVNGGTEIVVRFDPASGTYQEIPVGMYAHSLDIGPGGDIWVNDYFAAEERIARVARNSMAVTSIPVPPARRPASEGLPLPYGLQVDSRGRLYSTQLAANTLVRYDTRSGAGALFEMPAPNSGPRRPGLDRSDGLWIPEFNTGHLAFFDPDSERFRRIDLGSSTLGLYDVEVNQANDDVWVTGSLASELLRYRPGDGSILKVPLPTEPAYTRHLAVDEATGEVWTAYSSLPAATPRVARLRFID
jgi:virginiamycin B lyase